MNGSAGINQQMGGQQPLPGRQSGPVMYGSGIVFGGHVYPVLIDGVPIQPPAGAHQAAVQQRLQMQPMQQQQPAGDHQRMQMQQRPQVPHPHQTFPKPVLTQRAYQRGTPYGAKLAQPQNPRAFGRVPGGGAPSMTQLKQPLYNYLQQAQQQQLAAMGGYSGSGNFNYDQQPSAGGDSSGNWGGYAMWQHSDVNKPFTIDWRQL